jgi:hypothetical protein
MGGGGNSMGLSSTHRVAKRSSFRKFTGIPVMINAHGHETCDLVAHHQIKTTQKVFRHAFCARLGWHPVPTYNRIVLDRQKFEASQCVQNFRQKRAKFGLAHVQRLYGFRYGKTLHEAVHTRPSQHPT